MPTTSTFRRQLLILAILAALAVVALLAGRDAAGAQGAPSEAYRLVDTWTTRSAGTGVPQFRLPAGIDTAAGGDIYVVDAGLDLLYQLAPTGQVEGSWTATSATGQRRDVAVSSDRIYVAGNPGTGEIRDRTDGRVIRDWPVSQAQGVAVGPNRRVYVSRVETGGRGVIEVHDTDGNRIETWRGDPFIIRSAFGIDVAADGRVYMAADGAVYVFEDGAVTSLLRVHDNEGPALIDVAVDDQGRVFALQNDLLFAWEPGTGNRFSNVVLTVVGARWLAIGPGGGLIVSTTSSRSFTGLSYYPDRSDLSATPLQWGDADETLGQLVEPQRVAVTGGDLLVADAQERVQRWSATGEPREQWATEGVVDVAGGAGPCALSGQAVSCLGPSGTVAWERTPNDEGWMTAIDGDGSRVAAVDLAGQELVLYDRSGNVAGGWDLSGPTGFRAISDIAVGGGSVYMADRLTRRVEIFGLDGRSRGAIDVQSEALRLSYADGMLYALSRDGWIWKFDGSGSLRSVWRPVADRTPSDLAAGPGGRVYVADAKENRVLVFEPNPAGPPPITPEPPDQEACTLRPEKRAAPDDVLPDEPVLVELVVGGACPYGRGAIDVVLILDQSNSMAGPFLTAAKSAAISFLGELDPTNAQVGVVGLSTSATVLQPLTGNLREIVLAVARMFPTGQTNYADALDTALAEITGPSGRPDVPRIVVLLTDGQPSDRRAAERAASDVKSAGVTLYTIGLGDDVNEELLASMATDPVETFFLAPSEAKLGEIYTAIARRLTAATILTSGTVTDEIPPDMELDPSSVFPPATVIGRTLTWQLADVPATGSRLSYVVRPQEPGLRPTNVRASLDFVDTTGKSGQLLFPVPRVNVRAYYAAALPYLARSICRAQRADVVLVFDTSSSMNGPAGGGVPLTKLEAALQAGRAFLDAMALPGDQAAVVSFDSAAELVQGLTGSRPALQFALAGIRSGSGTRIDLGLELAFAEMLSSRRNARNNPVIILLTDGRPAGGSEGNTLVAARRARRAGFDLFVIGLGTDVDPVLLLQVAGSASRYFLAPDASELEGVYDRIAGEVLCEGG